MTQEIKKISVDNRTMLYQRPDGTGPFHVVLMLHGWTGDENSMWVFAPKLLKNSLLIAPRGLYPAPNGGYSWHLDRSKSWPWINDFTPAIEWLFTTITGKNFPDGDFSQLHLIGFSQGAALAYTMTVLHPEKITSLAGLSGFMPDGAAQILGADRLKGLPVFIAHGTQDNLVPVVRARAGVELLQNAGASVTYCEDDVGHKLSARCFRGLEAFYSRLSRKTAG